MAFAGPFVLKQKLLGQLGLNRGGAVFCFPLFQCFVIPAFSLDDFTGVVFFVDLHLARLAAALRNACAAFQVQFATRPTSSSR